MTGQKKILDNCLKRKEKKIENDIRYIAGCVFQPVYPFPMFS